MLRTTLKSLAARRLRLLLTATAIVLGVTFVTGTLVLTDTSTRLFDEQFAGATAGVDVVVRDAAEFGAAMGVEVDRDPVPDEVVQRLRRLPGVAGAEGVVRGPALLVVDGQPVLPGGPTIGASWAPEPYNPFPLRSGRAPKGAGEVVIDQATAAAGSVSIGDRVAISLEDGSHPFEVVGTAGFGDAAGIPNTTVALFAPAVAQELFAMGGGWSEAQVVADAVTADRLRDRLAAELGDEFDITSSRDAAAASAAAAQEQLAFVRAMLLALAATALLVGAFMIANTFAIVVAQRTREFATLRALGASRRQVLGTVLVEALTVATIASVAGVALGVAAAAGLRRLAGSFGVVVPDGPLTVLPRTLVVGLVIGVVVTLVSAVVPARRAARVAPAAAMRDTTASPTPLTRRRLVGGSLAVVFGTGAALAGAVTGGTPIVGLGAAAIAVGAIALSPGFAGPVAAAAGRLMGRRVVTRLARRNVRRAARRTASTAMALALGLAVVTFMTVVASSVKSAMRTGIDEVVQAELVIQSARGEMLGGLSPHVHHHASQVPGVATASRMRFGHWQLDGSTQALTAVDPATFPQVADLDMVAGDVSALGADEVILADNIAAEGGWTVGDELPMTFSASGRQNLTVTGIFDGEDSWAVSTGYLISLETFTAHFAENVDATVYLRLADDADLASVRTRLERTLADFPTAAIYDQAEAKAARTRTLDSMLGLVTALLVLAVLIALLGITNALALSVVERTREIGMLRAVGMTPSQLRRMIRVESALTAAAGGVTGIVLGIGLAAAVVRALPGAAVVPLTLPPAHLTAFLVVSTVGGLLAGALPGRRAARMDVLDAIATA